MLEKNELVISSLGHTWILDLDGTIVEHNGYKIWGNDMFLDGALQFLKSIPEKDMIIIITSRPSSLKELTEGFLKENGVRFDNIIFDAPYGERIIVNDDKPDGLKTAYAINATRNKWCGLHIVEDDEM